MTAQLGLIGAAAMGRNLAFNFLDHGVTVVGHDDDDAELAAAIEESGRALQSAADLPALVAELERPRRILLMDSGAALLERLTPLLERDDLLIDASESWFRDTQQRAQRLAGSGIVLLDVGLAGGPHGARHGASLMAGGDASSYAAVAPLLEAVAAEGRSGRCTALLGPGGCGHFVKAVHDGIEQAAMQIIAEIYDLLTRVLRLDAPAVAETFAAYQRTRVESYLLERTVEVVRRHQGDDWLGRDDAPRHASDCWAARAALEHEVPAPSIVAAATARMLSGMKSERAAAAACMEGPAGSAHLDPESFARTLQGALEAAMLTSYAQGMALIAAAARDQGWSVDLDEVARVWTAGSGLRARLLDDVIAALQTSPAPLNLMLDEAIHGRLCDTQGKLRQAVVQAQRHGIPAPVLGASLAYYDSYRSEQLPQHLTRALRDG